MRKHECCPHSMHYINFKIVLQLDMQNHACISIFELFVIPSARSIDM